MADLYPLRFRPTFRRYLWGGRRLGEILGKPIGSEADYAESWEIVDHGADQSVVAQGALTGMTLGELVRDRGPELLGRHQSASGFPLLFKYLDCQQPLSVQVHPDDQQARQLDPPDLGKTEAWIILDAAPGSRLYAGLKRGVDRATLSHELARGTVEGCLHRIQPRIGDCLLIPAGTVHALGAGLLVAEIQQASDTTFRLYDWNRVGPDGRPRPLHVERALDTIRYACPPIEPQVPQPTSEPGVQCLVHCDQFIVDRWHSGAPRSLLDDGRFHILSVIAGEVDLSSDPSSQPLTLGQTILLPAKRTAIRCVPRGPAVVLDMYLA